MFVETAQCSGSTDDYGIVHIASTNDLEGEGRWCVTGPGVSRTFVPTHLQAVADCKMLQDAYDAGRNIQARAIRRALGLQDNMGGSVFVRDVSVDAN